MNAPRAPRGPFSRAGWIALAVTAACTVAYAWFFVAAVTS